MCSVTGISMINRQFLSREKKEDLSCDQGGRDRWLNMCVCVCVCVSER